MAAWMAAGALLAHGVQSPDGHRLWSQCLEAAGRQRSVSVAAGSHDCPCRGFVRGLVEALAAPGLASAECGPVALLRPSHSATFLKA